jgi:hypothetical protein
MDDVNEAQNSSCEDKQINHLLAFYSYHDFLLYSKWVNNKKKLKSN